MRTTRRIWLPALALVAVLLLAVPTVWALGGGGGHDEFRS